MHIMLSIANNWAKFFDFSKFSFTLLNKILVTKEGMPSIFRYIFISAPSSPPQMLHASVVSTNSIMVSWKPPLESNGRITVSVLTNSSHSFLNQNHHSPRMPKARGKGPGEQS